MSWMDGIFNKVTKKKKNKRKFIEPNPEPVDTQPEEAPEVEMSLTKKVRISGYDVTYMVPEDMGEIKVRILAENGTFLSEYTLTKYLDIRPGQRVQLKVSKR